MKTNLSRAALCLLFAVVVPATSSCARKTEVRTVDTVDSGPPGDARAGYRHEERSTTVEREKVSDECSGVLSCAVDVVGEIIAFPFKAVGALAGAIF